jgi:hypothetical protein
VADVERADLVAVVADRLARLELDDAERVAKAAVDEPHRAHEVGRAGWPVDRERRLAVAQVEGLQHSRQAEPVVGVQMGEIDRLDVRQADRAQQLALGALAAIEEQPVAATAHEDGREAAPRGRHRAGGAGEEQRQVHPPASVASGRCCGSSGPSSCAATSSTSPSRS